MNREKLKEIKPMVLDYYKKHKNTKSLPEIAEEFEIKYNTLYRWINKRTTSTETLMKDIERTRIRNKNKLAAINVKLDDDFLELFKNKCNEKDISQASVVREIIENYIEKKESDFEQKENDFE